VTGGCLWELPRKHDTTTNPKYHNFHPASASSPSKHFVTPTVLPPSSTSSAGHTHLLSHYYGINGDSPNDQDSPTTILSRLFDGTQSLFEVAARLVDGEELLNDALTTITDKNATTKMTNIAIKVIRKSVLPLMDIALMQ